MICDLTLNVDDFRTVDIEWASDGLEDAGGGHGTESTHRPVVLHGHPQERAPVLGSMTVKVLCIVVSMNVEPI